MEKVVHAYHKCRTPHWRPGATGRTRPVSHQRPPFEMNRGGRGTSLLKWLDRDTAIEDAREDRSGEGRPGTEPVCAQLHSGLFSQIPSNTLGRIQRPR